MLNRVQSPEIQQITNLQLPPPKLFHLDNGIPVYATSMGTQEVVKLEIVFNAGRPFEKCKLVSRATASLLKEGTKNYSSADIAEQMDFYGSTLSIPVNLDTSNIILYSLTKHFDKVLPLIAEMLNEPAFPDEEIQSFKERNKQRLQVDLTRNDVIAYRKITEFIFGSEHPYGYNSYVETYDQLKRNDIINHFKNNYVAENCIIFISGIISDEILKSLNLHLGNSILRGVKNSPQFPEKVSTTPKQVFIPKKDAVQTAIRIGTGLFNRHHPDFKGLYVMNTILGGYFGSRLMANIREEKGYTYNIYSTLDAMRYGGCFYVGTEVGNEFVDKTVKEIYKEFDLLKQELIDDDELKMVQNYLLGNMLTMLDGPFNVGDVIKTSIIEDLPIDDFGDLVKVIQNITKEDIRDLARKYLNKEQMWEVIVGSKE